MNRPNKVHQDARLQADILRILDANFNRSREGLRVCEEVLRFVLEDRLLTARLKKARHDVSACLKKLAVPLSELVASRDVYSDVGKETTRSERARHTAMGLFLANAERVKESLRVLEEAGKLVDPALSSRIKKVRFQIYAIEKKALPKLEALRYHGR